MLPRIRVAQILEHIFQHVAQKPPFYVWSAPQRCADGHIPRESGGWIRCQLLVQITRFKKHSQSELIISSISGSHTLGNGFKSTQFTAHYNIQVTLTDYTVQHLSTWTVHRSSSRTGRIKQVVILIFRCHRLLEAQTWLNTYGSVLIGIHVSRLRKDWSEGLFLFSIIVPSASSFLGKRGQVCYRSVKLSFTLNELHCARLRCAMGSRDN